jgi:hypothetical protein
MKTSWRLILSTGWTFGLLFLSGCGLLYTNIRAPYSYRSATPADVHAAPSDATATGEGCSTSLLYLVMWGDAGYAAAVRDALKNDPLAVLYDVKVDFKVNSYALGLYTRACTVATGKIGHP